MKRLNIAILALGFVALGCNNLGVNTGTIDEGDVEFVAQSTSDETSLLTTDLQDPGSPVLNRYYTGGFFVWNYEDNGGISTLAFPDTLQDSVRLTCVSHSDTMLVDNDGDRVFQHDDIIFNCQNEHFFVMRGGNLFDITLTLEGKITHNDANDNDRAVFQVTWGGVSSENFHKEVLVIKTTPSGTDTVINRNVDTHGEIRFDRDTQGITFHKERFIRDNNNRTFDININGHILTQDWEPGNPINEDMEIEFSGTGTATTASGRDIELRIHTDSTITVGVCESGQNTGIFDSEQRVGVKGGRVIEDLLISSTHVRTITIEFNPDCTHTITQD